MIPFSSMNYNYPQYLNVKYSINALEGINITATLRSKIEIKEKIPIEQRPIKEIYPRIKDGKIHTSVSEIVKKEKPRDPRPTKSVKESYIRSKFGLGKPKEIEHDFGAVVVHGMPDYLTIDGIYGEIKTTHRSLEMVKQKILNPLVVEGALQSILYNALYLLECRQPLSEVKGDLIVVKLLNSKPTIYKFNLVTYDLSIERIMNLIKDSGVEVDVSRSVPLATI